MLISNVLINFRFSFFLIAMRTFLLQCVIVNINHGSLTSSLEKCLCLHHAIFPFTRFLCSKQGAAKL